MADAIDTMLDYALDAVNEGSYAVLYFGPHRILVSEIDVDAETLACTTKDGTGLVLKKSELIAVADEPRPATAAAAVVEFDEDDPFGSGG